MTISYIILAHKEPMQLQRLVKRLTTPDSHFYIHVDRNVAITPFETALKGLQHVKLLPMQDRVASIWGSPGLVKATLAGMRAIIKDQRNGYTILLSGQCYPIKSNDTIAAYLKKHEGYNFIEGFDLPDDRWPSSSIRLYHYAFFLSPKKEDFITVPSLWDQVDRTVFTIAGLRKYLKVFLHYPISFFTVFRKRRFPLSLKPVGGMQWWALPNKTIHFIIEYLARNPAYANYHSRTLFSDEIFFQTLVHNHFSNVKAPVTFSHWVGEESCSSPETLTAAHLPLLKERPELFARKFDSDADTLVLDIIDRNLLLSSKKEKEKFWTL